MLEDDIFDPTWHYHSEYQLFLVLKGKGTRFIGDHIKPFRVGDITFTGPDLPHLWKSDQKGGCENSSQGVVIYFNEDLFGDSLLEKEEFIKIRQLLFKSRRGIDLQIPVLKKVKSMMINLLNCNGFNGVIKLLEILHFLSESEHLTTIASSGYTNTLRDGDTIRMNKVYDFVLKNFDRKIHLEELSEITNMTTSSFSRYFKIHANKTFSEFLSEIRIGHACKLLIESKTNVSEACYRSGFQTISNFNRQFKRIAKKTPKAYKKAFESSMLSYI